MHTCTMCRQKLCHYSDNIIMLAINRKPPINQLLHSTAHFDKKNVSILQVILVSSVLLVHLFLLFSGLISEGEWGQGDITSYCRLVSEEGEGQEDITSYCRVVSEGGRGGTGGYY